MTPTREVDIIYRDCIAPMKVSSPYDEYIGSVMAKVYGIAVDTGKLPPLLCEE